MTIKSCTKALAHAFCISLLLAGAAHAEDLRAVRIEKFLVRHCPTSPLRGRGEEIVFFADKHGLDYRLYVAIAGAESSWGLKYPKKSHNFTGICNGRTRFASISDNIRFTHETISTRKWYRKYRKTRKIEDMVYVYKGVPPFDRYIRSLRFTLDMISAVSIAKEKEAALAAPKPQTSYLLAWNSIRYDNFDIRKTSTINLAQD